MVSLSLSQLALSLASDVAVERHRLAVHRRRAILHPWTGPVSLGALALALGLALLSTSDTTQLLMMVLVFGLPHAACRWAHRRLGRQMALLVPDADVRRDLQHMARHASDPVVRSFAHRAARLDRLPLRLDAAALDRL